MPTEYQDSPKQKKPARSPKNSPAKRKPSTVRVSGYRPKAKNALYQLAAEFKRRHPKSTASEAWQHFAGVAELGGSDVIVSHDPATDTLSYRPDIEKVAVRQLRRRSFEQRWYALSG